MENMFAIMSLPMNSKFFKNMTKIFDVFQNLAS